MQVTTELIIHLQHSFVLQGSPGSGAVSRRCWLCRAAQFSEEAGGDAGSGVILPQPLGSARVCAGLASPAGTAGTSLTHGEGSSSSWKWAAQTMQGDLENTETLSFSVLESAAAKPHLYAVTCTLISLAGAPMGCQVRLGRNSTKTCNKIKNRVKGRVIITASGARVQSREWSAADTPRSVHMQEHKRGTTANWKGGKDTEFTNSGCKHRAVGWDREI